MKESGAEVLAGRARSVSAKHYLINEIDRMVQQYDKAWKNYRVVYPTKKGVEPGSKGLN
jgi:hypothetical protein